MFSTSELPPAANGTTWWNSKRPVSEQRPRKLKRHVTTKILPPSVAVDAERLARFLREVEVLSLRVQSAVFSASKNLREFSDETKCASPHCHDRALHVRWTRLPGRHRRAVQSP